MIVNENTRLWVHGLFSAMIGSAAGSTGAMIVDPAQFNIDTLHGLRNVCLAGVFSAVTHMLMYLARSPLPEIKTIQRETSVTDGTSTETQKTTITKPAA